MSGNLPPYICGADSRSSKGEMRRKKGML